MNLLFFGRLGWTEIIVIAIVVMLLFGANKIPQLMRNIGKGIHSFKQGLEDAKEEINKEVQRSDAKEDKKEDKKEAQAPKED